jgi:protein HOOK3
MEKLREQLKTANQKILLLSQGQNEDQTSRSDLVLQLRQALELNEQRHVQIEESQSQIANLHSKVTQVETSLAAREQELVLSETKYKKCVEKAKEVIKTLDPRAVNGW